MRPSISIRLLLTQSDARLAEFARAGHERAFEALAQRYRRPLLAYCRRLLLSEERAEDALQQALLQAWLALRNGTQVGDVKPWLYRIVHNTALNAVRSSRYDYAQLNESLTGSGAPQEDLDRRIAVREALAGLAALPEMQREALLRTAVDGGSHREVARELGLSEHALRGLVYRARATLRAAAGAIVPPQLVSWALGSGTRGTPVIGRLAEVGAGGGSAGVAGVLMKGGAVAVTASVLAGGIVAVHDRSSVRHTRSGRSAQRHALRPPPRGARVTVASARTPISTPPLHANLHATGGSARRANPWRHRPSHSTVPFTTKITPSGTQQASVIADERPQQDRREGGAGEQSGTGEPHAPASTTRAGGSPSEASGGRGSDAGQHGETIDQGNESGRGADKGGSAPGASSSDGHAQAGQDNKSESPTEGAGQAGKSEGHEDSSKSNTAGSSKDQPNELDGGAVTNP